MHAMMSQGPTSLRLIAVVVMTVAAHSGAARGAVVNGAEGRASLGELHLTAGESRSVSVPVSLPGRAHLLVYDSMLVEGGTTLTFIGATGAVAILVTGAVTIDGTIAVRGESGRTDLAGRGGPGGARGGAPAEGVKGPQQGAGQGGGAALDCESTSTSGGAAHALATSAAGATPLGPAAYGEGTLLTLVGGSGGGGSDAGGGPNALHQSGGGGGGGAILITSDTSITVTGTIDARGGDAPTTGSRACKSPGSGGAIRLVAPVVSITGTLDVRGGTFGDGTAETGSPGRVRIDTLSPASVNFLGVRPSLAELGNDPARVDATRSVGTNLVAFPDVMPELTITHFRGVPLPRGPATTLPIYVEATGSSEQLITLSAAGLGQANAIIAITPRQGPRILSSPIALDTTSGPVTWTGPVTLPGNVDARIDVWVTP